MLVTRKLGLAALTALLFHVTPVTAVTVEESLPPASAASNVGDLWTFYCPPGGTYSLSVNTDSVDYPTAVTGTGDRSALDPYALVLDATGAVVGNADDEMNCTFESIFTANPACPQISDAPCGLGRHYVSIQSLSGLAGGAYTLTVTAEDSQGVPLTDAKIKLGGGPKPKLPKILDPNLNPARVSPLVDDSKLSYP